MNGKPLARGEKRLIVTSVVVIGSVLGFFAWQRWLDSEPYVAYPPSAARPDPNGFDLYGQAALALVPFKPPVDQMEDPDFTTDPKISAQRFAGRYGVARRDAWMRANARAFKLFDEAQRLPCVGPDQRQELLFPVFARLRSLTRAKAMAANTAKLHGDWAGAMRHGLDAIQMGTDIPRGGGLISRLVGIACTAIGRITVEDTVDHLTGAEAGAAARRLEGLIARRVPYAEVLKEDKWIGIASFLRETRGKDWRQDNFSDGAFNGGEDQGFSLRHWLRLKMVSKRAIVARIEQDADESMAAVKKPYAAPKTPPASNDGSPVDILDRYSGINPNLAALNARDETGLNLFLLRLALRAYTEERGAPPRMLAELSPAYLKAIPLDAYANGGPLHYVPRGKTYTLWSVGPDGKNDNGKPIPATRPAQPSQFPRKPSVLLDGNGDWVAGQNS